jgi:hypothetical protein
VPANLTRCGVSQLHPGSCHKFGHGLLTLSWSIAAERLWSFAARHGCPVDTYAGYFGPTVGVKEVFFNQMMSDAERLYWLDRQRLGVDSSAKELWSDCRSFHSKPIRATYAFFDRDGPHSEAGSHLLRGLLETLPDNKGVEELHFVCKQLVKRNYNKKVSRVQLQHTIMTSGILERRGVGHDARVRKAYFLKRFRDRNRRPCNAADFRAATHKLPRAWSDIMGHKAWRTTTEADDRSAASAWHLLQSLPMSPDGLLCIHNSRLSRFLLAKTIFSYQGRFLACMGRGKWSALAWPLEALLGPDGFYRWTFECGAPASGRWRLLISNCRGNVP